MSSEAMGPADRGNRHISEIEVTEFTSDVKCLDDELVIGREVRGRGRRRQRTEPETFIPGDSAGQKRRERERERERVRGRGCGQ